MSPINAVSLFSTRIIASGTLSLASGATSQFLGENSRQKRRQFIISNLSAGSSLKLCTITGRIFATVRPGTSWTIDTDDNIQVYNPNPDAVDFEVCELFYDAGTPDGIQWQHPSGFKGVAATASSSPAATTGGGYFPAFSPPGV